MNKEIKHANLTEALFAAQKEMPVIGKNKKGVHGADYADYEKVWDVVHPIAKKHGLLVTNNGNGKEVVTTVHHIESKESLDSKLEMSQIDAQKRGAEVTYYMRYNLKMLFNLVIADEDKDATGLDVLAVVKEELQGINDVNELREYYKKYKGSGKEIADLIIQRSEELNEDIPVIQTDENL